MTHISYYVCDICHEHFDTAKEAQQCEDQGRAEGDAEKFPIGMILGEKDGFYSNMTFALAQHELLEDRHSSTYVTWACRDGGPYGDSLGHNLCCSPNGNDTASLRPGYNDTPDIHAAHFKRMVSWLQSRNIPVTVWDGTRAVPLEEYLDTHKV